VRPRSTFSRDPQGSAADGAPHELAYSPATIRIEEVLFRPSVEPYNSGMTLTLKRLMLIVGIN
jgi:hypothetical protein